MPASLRTSPANPRRSILLLEEYDALSAAIGAALRKFAPEHDLAIAKTLRDAEIFAGKNAPELFVIDADPPWAGITNFLEKLRTKHPDARALVIGAPLPAEIAAARGLSGALQFVDKPFDLAAFGAAVQALLGPWRESQVGGLRGSLGSLSAMDIMLLHYAANATVIVDLRAGKTPFGEIEIYGGEVAHAEAGKLIGAEALREILTSPELRMSERSDVAVARQTIKPTWQSIVLEVLAARPPEVASPVRTEVPLETRPAKARTGKKIVAIDDTEMLLVFVEGVLTTADETLQVFTAKSGAEGLALVESAKPDLVLLDYFLPDINGEEISRRLRDDERTSRIPVVMMSAHMPQITRAASYLDNIVATVEKPFFSKQLVEIVQRSLTAPPRKIRAKAAPISPPQAPPARPKRVEIPAAPPPAPTAPASLPPPVQRVPPPPPIAKPTIFETPAVGAKEAVLGLFLEVISMQFTPQLQMGSILARPASLLVSLHLPGKELAGALPPQVGFQLAATETDAKGQIAFMRLVPSGKPFQAAQTRNVFEIGSVAVVPADARQRVQLTPTGSAPMTVELIAHAEVAGVQLSSTFQLAQLALRWLGPSVRVTLNPKAPEASAARFDITDVKLSASGQIAELTLDPVK